MIDNHTHEFGRMRILDWKSIHQDEGRTEGS